LRRFLFFFAAIVLILLLGLAFGWARIRSQLERPYYGGPPEGVYADIPRGMNINRIADLLAEKGILANPLPFRIYVRYTGMGRRIQAGEYRFFEPATPVQVARRLIGGDIYFRSVTVPEGLTARETVELLARNGLGDLREMERALSETKWIRDLDPKAKNLEGYLFPETYRFGRKIASAAILKTMVDQFRASFSEIMAQSPGDARFTVAQIIILASLIEKEIRQPEEAPLVASVLLNRLERKMPLACDATVIYAMKLAGIYRGRLGRADLRMESPYNSYLHPGLPPGPIANPGARSIRAALNPARTDFLYYVSRNDGTHQFSRDYRSHVNAVNKYQRSSAARR
jgi:UPF0755 protein